MKFKSILSGLSSLVKFPLKLMHSYAGTKNEYSVEYWQAYIFYCLTFFGLTACFLNLIPTTFYLLSTGQLVFCAVNIALFFIILLVIGLRKIPLKIKATSVSLMLSLVGIVTLVYSGPVGQNGIWFLSAALLTCLFAVPWISITIAVINLLSGLTFTFLYAQGLIKWEFLTDYHYSGLAIQAVMIFLISLVFVFSNTTLIRGVKKVFAILNKSKEATIIGLAKLAEYRDNDTGTHLEKIRDYTYLLVNAMSGTDRYKKYVDEQYLNDMCVSSVLHDIGKVGISDSVLLKPGKLTDGEFDSIKQHTIIGKKVIQEITKHLDDMTIYSLAENIAEYHHEKWDGSGYMGRLSGDAIPLSARIIAIIDVYDAITSRRVYKEARTHAEALDYIKSQSGKHFDPEIVDAFLRIADDINDLRKKFEPCA